MAYQCLSACLPGSNFLPEEGKAELVRKIVCEKLGKK